MKRRPLHALILTLLAAGCSTLEHQVAETEPHAVVHFVEPLDDRGDLTVITRFDGVPVKTGRDYRVAPGQHRLTLRVSRFDTARFSPLQAGSAGGAGQPVEVGVSSSGKVNTSGVDPLATGVQPVNLSVETREILHTTNVIALEAGWRYELDGANLRRTPSARPRQ